MTGHEERSAGHAAMGSAVAVAWKAWRNISDAEARAAATSHRPRSGQGSFAQRQSLEERVRELEGKLGQAEAIAVPLAQISPNPWQPRRRFDEAELQRLAASIRTLGLVQAIIVRPVSNRDTAASEIEQAAAPRYQIIVGERRYRAHRLLEEDTIKAHILEVSDEEMVAYALAENIDRTDLTAFEIALAIRSAEAAFASKTSLAEALGFNRTALYKYLAFFKLPAFVLADLETHPGLLGRDAADALASLLASAGEPAHARLQAIWPRVKAGELEQGKIVSTIAAALQNRGPIRTARQIQKLFVGKAQAGSITRDGSALTVKIRAAALTPEKEAELVALVELNGLFHLRRGRAIEIFKGSGRKPACHFLCACGSYFRNLRNTFIKTGPLVEVVVMRIPLALDFFPPGIE